MIRMGAGSGNLLVARVGLRLSLWDTWCQLRRMVPLNSREALDPDRVASEILMTLWLGLAIGVADRSLVPNLLATGNRVSCGVHENTVSSIKKTCWGCSSVG